MAQAKRTNIGIALITHPRVLFLDEPTSGLDSYTSHEVTSTCHIHLAVTADSLPAHSCVSGVVLGLSACLPYTHATGCRTLWRKLLTCICTFPGWQIGRVC